MNFDFWTRWLIVTAAILVLFGLALAFFNQSDLFDALFNSNVNLVFWGVSVIPQATFAFQRWVYAVLGATVAGWGVTLSFLAYHPFRKRELWAWNCILFGMLVWYLPDTVLSMVFGVHFNAAFNTLLFVLVLIPLIFTRQEFSAQPPKRRRRHPTKGAA